MKKKVLPGDALSVRRRAAPRIVRGDPKDAVRFPWLDDAGRVLLQRLREHPHGPRFNHPCGDLLTAEGLERVRAFERALDEAPRGWAWNEPPGWVGGFIENCLREVPFYRKRAAEAGVGAGHPIASVPTISRADLGRVPEAFVPDGLGLDEMLVYWTTGLTGPEVLLPSNPETVSMYLPALRWALCRFGVKLDGGPGRVALLTVCDQKKTFTYPSLSSYLGGAGYVKLNLDPADWSDPADRAAFIDDCAAEVYTGDPVAFLALATLPTRHRPKALVSTAMTLLPAWKEELEKRFGCPVLDVYSLTECRFIAVREPLVSRSATGPTSDRWEIVPHDLYVEILDEAGRPCPPGIRGEITITGGRNPYCPLLRYRTGDYAAMVFDAGKPQLVDLSGRQPVLFLSSTGTRISPIDVSTVLKPYALAQFALHQHGDRSLRLRYRALAVDESSLKRTIGRLFGADLPLTVECLDPAQAVGGKVLEHTSEILTLGEAQP